MRFLGNFLLGQEIRFRVTWTPDAGQPAISASGLTLTHEGTGAVLGPLVGVGAPAPNVWEAIVEPTLRGNWRVEWATTPDGGVTKDRIYVS